MFVVKYLLQQVHSVNIQVMKERIAKIHLETKKPKCIILTDMLWCAVRYGAGYRDYDLFELYDVPHHLRKTYITRGRNSELVKKYCDVHYLHFFQNKNEFNNVFAAYLKRDWIDLQAATYTECLQFMQKQKTFFCKPIDTCCGKGIEKVTVQTESDCEQLYAHLQQTGLQYILEEPLRQHPAVSQIYPDSINTVRIVTIVKNKIPHVICSYFRIGHNGFVDNFNHNGMVTPVDVETGIIKYPAMDKSKNVFLVHPQTGTPIKGFHFPDWEAAQKLCLRAAMEIPQMGYIGWDVCFTPSGPCLVEGNEFPGYDLYQLPVHTPNKVGLWPIFQI